MTSKALYDKYKREHRCVDCSTELEEEYTKVRCSRCLGLRGAYNERKRETKNRNVVERVVQKIHDGEIFRFDTRNTQRIIVQTYSRDGTIVRSVNE